MSESRTNSQRPPVPLVNKGQAITARWLSNVARTLNDHSEALRAPASLAPLSKDSQAYDPDGAIPEGQLGTGIWVETGRDVSTVRVEDPNDSSIYVEVERIDAISFARGAEVMTLVFNND